MISQPAKLACYLVNNLTSSSVEQCKFIIDNECLEDGAIIDYVYIVYCQLGQELRSLSILLLVCLVIVFFLALSAVADEFLCPSLLAVAKNLRMSDSLAGVTLLAFGNGCPDIFSSLAAASNDQPELIVGELLGAGIFCTSIVAGLVFIQSDFKPACRPILRDTTFYLLAVYLVWYSCGRGKITFYVSLTFILIYVIYLIVALSGQAIHSRLTGDYQIAEKQASLKVDSKDNWFNQREGSMKKRATVILENKFSERSSLTRNVKFNQNNGVTSAYLGAGKVAAREMELYSISSSNGYTNKGFVIGAEDSMQPSTVVGDTKKGAIVVKLPPESTGEIQTRRAARKRNDVTLLEWDEFLASINPIETETWPEMSIWSKLINITRAPLLLLTILTVPVVDLEKREKNWNRLLNSLHCLTVPLAATIFLRPSANDNIDHFWLPLPVLVLIPGLILAAIVLSSTNSNVAPSYHSVFAYVGFVMSIMWIYLLATEIISLLKTVGIMFSMTDTAIGLGILAWGNSLGDIVANLSLAEAGYPRMALGASIGAPLLNLLLGFGLSFTISLKPGEFSYVKYSPTTTLLCVTLAGILLAHMLSTLAPPDRSKKLFGYLLISVYGIYFILAVILECELIKF